MGLKTKPEPEARTRILHWALARLNMRKIRTNIVHGTWSSAGRAHCIHFQRMPVRPELPTLLSRLPAHCRPATHASGWPRRFNYGAGAWMDSRT